MTATTNTFTRQNRTILGDLTTTFSPSPTCLIPAVWGTGKSAAWLGQVNLFPMCCRTSVCSYNANMNVASRVLTTTTDTSQTTQIAGHLLEQLRIGQREINCVYTLSVAELFFTT